MASIVTRKNGTREIQFPHDGKRRAVRLGKCSLRHAESFERNIEHLRMSAKLNMTPETSTMLWLQDLEDDVHDRIAKTGLITPRVSTRLDSFIERFIKDRGHEFEAATVTAWGYGKTTLIEYFGADKDIRTISEGDAQAYRAWLVKNKYAEATIRRRCGHAKNMLGYAVRLGLIADNPFGNKAVPTAAPKSKPKTFIEDALSRRILDNLPNARWRAIWTLGRWGGVRVPSEIVALRWDGVDLDNKRLVIHSPKTERHDGHARRIIPMFPEIERAMIDWYHATIDTSPLVFPGASTNGGAYRHTLLRAIKLSGGQPWNKLWTAARATRREELEQPMDDGMCLPEKVVDAWMGHSKTIGRAHYNTNSPLVEKAFDAVLGTTDESAAQSAVAESTQDHPRPSENPRNGLEKPETGVRSWPTRTVGQYAIALLFKKLSKECKPSAAQSAESQAADFAAIAEKLDQSQRCHIFEVMKRLAQENAAHDSIAP